MLVQEIPMDNNLAAVSLRIDFKSAQSTGYAWQWMSFGALAVLFYLILGMRRPMRPLILILAIGILTPLLSTALFFAWRPETQLNAGELLPASTVPKHWRNDSGPNTGDNLARPMGIALCRRRRLR